jgi:hypothetical protein
MKSCVSALKVRACSRSAGAWQRTNGGGLPSPCRANYQSAEACSLPDLSPNPSQLLEGERTLPHGSVSACTKVEQSIIYVRFGSTMQIVTLLVVSGISAILGLAPVLDCRVKDGDLSLRTACWQSLIPVERIELLKDLAITANLEGFEGMAAGDIPRAPPMM